MAHLSSTERREVLSSLEDPATNFGVDLLGLPLDDRPQFFSQLIVGLQALRARTNLRYHSFYFRGANGRLNLRARNLGIFSQIAERLDEPTWMFHLRRNDYSRWFREAIKDDYLAQQTERIELRTDRTRLQSRHLIRELVGARYTLPE